MPDVVCLDTNVLLYAALGRKDEAAKWAVAQDRLADPGVTISVQSLAEFYSIATGPKYRLAYDAANIWIDRLAEFRLVEIDAPLVLEGVALSQRYRINYWDGAIIAACHRAGAGVLYSEDMNHDQMYGSVRVVNPFLQA